MTSLVKKLQRITDHSNDVTSVDFFNNTLITASNDKTIRVYRYNGGAKMFLECPGSPLLAHSYGVNMVRFAPCGKFFASCSRDGRIILWRLEDFEIYRVFTHGDGAWIRSISFAAHGGLFATAGESSVIKIWNYLTCKEVKSLSTNESSISCTAFSPDGEVLVTGDFDGRLILWDPNTPHKSALCVVLDAHDLTVGACDVTYSDSAEENDSDCIRKKYLLVSGGNDNFVKVWEIDDGKINLFFKGSYSACFISSCRFVNKDLLVSIGSDRDVHFWNPKKKSGSSMLSFSANQRSLLCCAASNSYFATGSDDNSLVIWEFDPEKILREYSNASELRDIDTKDIDLWSCDDVTMWIEGIGCKQYCELFLDQAIDGKRLCAMTIKNLHDLGIAVYCDRVKILTSVHALKPPDRQEVPDGNSCEEIPDEFICPITLDVMEYPMIAADGFSYEGTAIQYWFQMGGPRSPITNMVLPHTLLMPNRSLRSLILKYKAKNQKT